MSNLEKDEVLVESLGEHLFEHFMEAKDVEWDMFRIAVHPWEREQYLTNY